MAIQVYQHYNRHLPRNFTEISHARLEIPIAAPSQFLRDAKTGISCQLQSYHLTQLVFSGEDY